MINKEESILYSTGQIWKYRVGYIGGIIALALFGIQWFRDSMPGPWYIGMDIAGTGAVLATLIFPMIAVKCPKCGARWEWIAVNKKHGAKGFGWVVRQTSCPVCGTSATQLSGTPPH